jgi:hypothetical protein
MKTRRFEPMREAEEEKDLSHDGAGGGRHRIAQGITAGSPEKEVKPKRK